MCFVLAAKTLEEFGTANAVIGFVELAFRFSSLTHPRKLLLSFEDKRKTGGECPTMPQMKNCTTATYIIFEDFKIEQLENKTTQNGRATKTEKTCLQRKYVLPNPKPERMKRIDKEDDTPGTKNHRTAAFTVHQTKMPHSLRKY